MYNPLTTHFATIDTLQTMGGYSKEAAEILNDVFVQDPEDDRETVLDFTTSCTEYSPEFPSRRDYEIAKKDESFIKFELENGNILVCA